MAAERIVFEFKYFLFIAVSIFFLTSCTIKKDFLIIPSKNFDLLTINQYVRKPEPVRGEDNSYIITIIPIGMPATEQKAALKAIESCPGCVAVVDGTTSFTFIFLPPVCLVEQYVVEGTCLVIP
jgi:hypothetical protein